MVVILKRLDVLQFHFSERFPFAFTGSGIEELDARVRDSQRTIGEAAFVFQMEKEAAKLIFGHLVRRPFTEVGELSNTPQIAMDDPLSHACKMQVVFHSFVELAVKELRMNWIVVIDHLKISLLRKKQKDNKERWDTNRQHELLQFDSRFD